MNRILVVEDDAMMQNLMKSLLRIEGFEVVISGSGREGLEAAAKEKPDLIILDVNLPDINGLDVCRSLKSDPVTRHMPVIMLTGEAREVGQRVTGLEVGAEDYILKPFESKALIARIRALIKQVSKPV